MIADVAVPVAGIDDALSYLVPAALSARVRRGARVLVPVGARRLVGLVIAVRDVAARATKPLLEVLDDEPVVDAKQLALMRFVSTYYAAEIGLCARLVMPPGTETAVERRFQLTEQGERARVLSGDLNRHDIALLEAFGAGERKRERAFTRPQRERLHKLVARGLVEQVADEKAASAVRFDERLVAVDRGADGALPKGAPALAAFDAWLRAAGPSTMAQAQAAHANARGKAKRLEALGRLRIERTIAAGQAHAGVAAKAPASTLTDAQRVAVARITAALDDAPPSRTADDGPAAPAPTGPPPSLSAATREPAAFLLEGVTGSGKTEVYLRALGACLAKGRGAVLIVPEIGLTPQLVGRVQAALEGPPSLVVLHSGVSLAERRDAHARLRAGTARVVVGARSALFAPVQDLGLVVVDEEHDASLKQDEAPRYHARDVALWRAKNEGAVCVLGSATPSLESRHNAMRKKLELLELPARVGGGGALPVVEVVDLRARAGVAEANKRDRMNADEGPGVVLSAPLVEAMGEALGDGDQVLLFLNKRGYASAVLCEMCGHIETCPNCSVTLTLHRRRNVLVCHQCDHEHLVPATCTDCGNDALLRLGLGTERLEGEVRARFPDARVARLDRDSTRRRGALEEVLAAVHGRTVDIVVGTQMIAKGHDFPGVRLVGVVLADIALAMPDFRAAERAFALLAQVAGRAGRGDKRGRVVVQTYKPEAPAVAFAVTHDVKGFAAQELAERELHRYPPFSRAVLFRVEHEDASATARLASDVQARVSAAAAALPKGSWSALGPAPCALERLQGRTRWQVFVRTQSAAHRAGLIEAVRRDEGLARDLRRQRARLVIDVDPVHLL